MTYNTTSFLTIWKIHKNRYKKGLTFPPGLIELFIGLEFKYVARLAVKCPADCLHGRNPDGLCLAALQDGKVGRSYAHFFRKLAGRHLAAGKHYIYVDNNGHNSLFFSCGLLLGSGLPLQV